MMATKLRTALCLSLLLCGSLTLVPAQTTAAEAEASADTRMMGAASAAYSYSELDQVPEGRALLAMTNPEYPVTPGDVYTLAFLKATQVSSISLVVPNDFNVNLGVFGQQSARGMKFLEFKKRIEDVVARAYPGSSPELVIRSTGVFDVIVLGEVQTSQQVQAWGLSRLSSIFAVVKTEYSSSRSIQITRAGGQTELFDLFVAQRNGIFTQDPLLQPGDKITLVRAGRRIDIGGQVYRPGSYELLASEDLADALAIYAEGVTEFADISRVRISQPLAESSSVGEVSYVDLNELQAESVVLLNKDSVYVPSKMEGRPTVFFEGAISIEDRYTQDGNAVAASSNKKRYVFTPGEKLSSAVIQLRNAFTDISDLKNVYVQRFSDGVKIPVNLEEFLHNNNFSDDYLLQPNDLIVVPFRQFFVSVSGAVYQPGRYPYVPDRSMAYYIGLAGGVVAEKNNGNGHRITDLEGAARPTADFIQPEDTIFVPANSFTYYFGQVAPVLTTVVSVFSIGLTIYQLLKPEN